MKVKQIAKTLLNFMRAKRIVYVEKVCRPYELKIQKTDRFDGQVAVVTGASGSIGRSFGRNCCCWCCKKSCGRMW